MIDLHRQHLAGMVCQVLRQCTDTWPYFYHKIIFCNTCRIYNFIQHMGIDQKILSKLFAKNKIIFLQYGNRL